MHEYLLPYLDQVRIPTSSSNVHKEECCFSFTTPESDDGLFIDMNNFFAFSKNYALLNFQKTGHKLYLNIKRIFRQVIQTQEEKSRTDEEPPKKKPVLMGIGVSGGFEIDDNKKWEPEDFLSIVILPEFKVITLPDSTLPEKIQLAVTGIITASSAERKEEVNTWMADRKESKFAKTLKQLDNGVKVPPKGNKCTRCDLTENLWMNLTDGAILCGRRNFDGTGGNGHALEHYQQTGYPLCVKLGTITADGTADVYSYAEDDMVEDPFLIQHLAHFGIKVSQMEKTEKTMAEMEIDMNVSFDWSRIQEQDKRLVPVYGPGFTGMQNLGNSCYMASVMQTVFSLPMFQERYFANAENAFKDAPANPTDDFYTQMCKLACGLLSGLYSQTPVEVKEGERSSPSGIAPRMFKSVIGKGHPEFSTNHQQDVLEFFQHLLATIKKDEHKRSQGKNDPTKVFEFEIEERTQCSSSGKVQYVKRVDNILSLPIPLEKAVNKEEVKKYEAEQQIKKEEEQRKKMEAAELGLPPPKQENKENPVRPRVPLMSCLNTYGEPHEIADFYSTAIKGKTIGIRRNRLATFPKYLVFHMCKFTQAEDWTPKKLDIFLDVPDELDLEFLRGHGLQPSEETLPEEKSGSQKAEINEEIVEQLVSMGFPRERCVKAVYYTKNVGVELAMNWIMEHMDDSDIDAPLQFGDSLKIQNVNEDAVAMITGMGFSREKALKALKATNNDVERASDWIFSHMEDDDSMDVDERTEKKGNIDDGPGKYKLRAFISHMGTSTASGHYVCHIKKDDKWVLFNDNKVAFSDDPPKDMGYVYLFERCF